MQGILLFLFYFRKVCWAFGKREIIVNAKKNMSLHACNVWQRYTFFFCVQKNGNGFFVAIFLACCLTNCVLVVYAVFFYWSLHVLFL